MLSNLMNIGKKKISSLDSEKCVDTSGKSVQSYCILWHIVTQSLLIIGKICQQPNTSTHRPFSLTGYLNVLVNSQWRTRWCLIKNRQLMFYQDKGKSKLAQQPVSLEGCMVLPDPSPEHLYSFRIQMDGEELAILEVSSLTLSQPGRHNLQTKLV